MIFLFLVKHDLLALHARDLWTLYGIMIHLRIGKDPFESRRIHLRMGRIILRMGKVGKGPIECK